MLGLDKTFKSSSNFVFWGVFSVVIVYVLYKLYKGGQEAGKIANEIMYQAGVINSISQQTGIPKERLNQLDSYAKQVAEKLNRHKTQSELVSIAKPDDEKEAVRILNKVTSPIEATTLSMFFVENHSRGGDSLREVINDELGSTLGIGGYIEKITYYQYF